MCLRGALWRTPMIHRYACYYLPYRLHATREQLRAAYPRVDAFVAAKRRYDPQLRFRNALWDSYFA
jgi:hypothetical protein